MNDLDHDGLGNRGAADDGVRPEEVRADSGHSRGESRYRDLSSDRGAPQYLQDRRDDWVVRVGADGLGQFWGPYEFGDQAAYRDTGGAVEVAGHLAHHSQELSA